MSTQLLKVVKPNSFGDMVDARTTRRLTRMSGEHNSARQHRMAIFANDLIGIQINQYGLYEREELEILFNFLAPLASNFAEGLALDIGDTQGSFALIENLSNLGGSSIKIGDKSAGHVVNIEVETLDAQMLDTSDLCFMKIDVEGFEANVLKGGHKTIIERQPLIVFEQHESEFEGGTTASIAFLGSLGYHFCWHQVPTSPTNWLMRRVENIREMVSGRTHTIETADKVPKCNHSMLIGVPSRYQRRLGM